MIRSMRRWLGPIEERLYTRSQWTTVLLSTISSFFIWISAFRYGIGVSPDSTIYLDCARSIANLRGMESFMGIYHRYAPMYPIILSPFEVLRIGVHSGALLLNIALFIISALIVSSLIKKLIPRELFLASLVLVVISKPVINVHIMAWSEPLFIFSVLLAILFLSRFIVDGRWKSLLLSSTAASVAALSRYIGVTLIISGFIIILLHSGKGKVKIKKRIQFATAFGAISSIPTATFLLRNYIRTSTLLGDRPPSSIPFGDNLHDMSYSIINWFVPSTIPGMIMIPAMLSLIFLIPFSIFLTWKHSKNDPIKRSVALPLICFSSVYVAYLLAASAFVGFDRINERFMSPVFIPMTLIFMSALGTIRRKKHKGQKRRGKTFISRTSQSGKPHPFIWGILILLMLSSILSVTVTSYIRAYEGAGGYSRGPWQESSLIKYLECNRPEGKLYSNDPWAINFLSGMRGLELSPRATYQNSDRTTDDLERLMLELEQKGTLFLAWFDDVERNYLMDLDELSNHIALKCIASLSDGKLYEMKSQTCS